MEIFVAGASYETPDVFPAPLMPVLLAGLLLVTACGRKDSEPAKTGPAPLGDVLSQELTVDTADLIADTLGAGIPTQDFHLVVDMEHIQEDGSRVSVHERVLEQARIGLGDPIMMADGALTFSSTDSLTGCIVDRNGQVVPGAQIGFGLLEVAPTATLEAFDPDGMLGLTPDHLEEKPTLIVYSSTDLSQVASLIAW
jgi:hypothetical protein